MVIPTFVRQALAGDPITVYGDGTQSRCFTHVADVVGALIRLADAPKAVGQVFNIGSNEEVTIADLARRVKIQAGSCSEIVRVPYSEAYEPGFEDMPRRVPDLTKIGGFIGYRPTRTLEQILEDVIASSRSPLVPEQPGGSPIGSTESDGGLALESAITELSPDSEDEDVTPTTVRRAGPPLVDRCADADTARARAARRRGFVARPTSDRWHKQPTALLGGVAIFASVVGVELSLVPLSPQARVILGASALFFLLGQVDDLVGLKPFQKLIGQLLGAVVVVSFGLTLPCTGSPAIDGAITLLWLVGITNAVNLLDNMDGLAAGIAAIASVFLARRSSSATDRQPMPCCSRCSGRRWWDSWCTTQTRPRSSWAIAARCSSGSFWPARRF